jgi:hypothetical protein
LIIGFLGDASEDVLQLVVGIAGEVGAEPLLAEPKDQSSDTPGDFMRQLNGGEAVIEGASASATKPSLAVKPGLDDRG